ncbi:cytochrome d ubiquinol oxidase, subunit II [Acetobacteraceae bacterium AT-5844]|nr:cytochrome d ubiquinol oxidase, subunit II [Acetobacteraceae bacterium AT-5844]
MILHELLDYTTLRLIWWVLIGVLLIGFAATDGFDLGVGVLSPFVAKTDLERRVALNAIGPVWEGNQVWLILGGGAIFAAWPPLYAVSFSGFYLAMFLTLAALILRPVGIKYRSKRPEQEWRQRWDWALFVAAFVPSLVFGVAVGNALVGAPFYFTPEMVPQYAGSFFGLLGPFPLLCGLLSLSMVIMHGGAWLMLKTSGPMAERSRQYGSIAAMAVIVLFALGGLVVWLLLDGYRITSPIVTDGPSNPLLKTVVREPGAWLSNFSAYPWMMIAPALGFIGALGALIGMRRRSEVGTLLLSKLSIFGVISTAGVSMFPFLLPSSRDPNASLTVWDSSSSHLTLFIMLVATVIFLPIILTYTAWVYKVLWGKVEEQAIHDNSDNVY